MPKAYSFKKYGLEDQIHIFVGHFHMDKSCDAADLSICKNFRVDHGKWYDDAVCIDLEQAKNIVLKISDQLCDSCVLGFRSE